MPPVQVVLKVQLVVQALQVQLVQREHQDQVAQKVLLVYLVQ